MKNFTNGSEFGFQEGPTEFEVSTGEFGYGEAEVVDKSAVIIFTDHYHIHGKIALVPGARLTDYMVESKLFIAVIDVEVKDKAGKLVVKTPFLNIHRDRIELIVPAELATLNY